MKGHRVINLFSADGDIRGARNAFESFSGVPCALSVFCHCGAERSGLKKCAQFGKAGDRGQHIFLGGENKRTCTVLMFKLSCFLMAEFL